MCTGSVCVSTSRPAPRRRCRQQASRCASGRTRTCAKTSAPFTASWTPPRALFVQLLSVSGVGPRMALATLSQLSAERLYQAIESGDEITLSRIPGVGKRTAQRMTLELRGKLSIPVDGVAITARAGDEDA